MIEAISGVQAQASVISTGQAQAQASATGFVEWMQDQVQQTDTRLQTADAAINQLVAGEVQNVHEVMISIQKATQSLELMVQVRDRLLEAYQEISRMQI